jgi:hypothetical protein
MTEYKRAKSDFWNMIGWRRLKKFLKIILRTFFDSGALAAKSFFNILQGCTYSQKNLETSYDHTFPRGGAYRHKSIDDKSPPWENYDRKKFVDSFVNRCILARY